MARTAYRNRNLPGMKRRTALFVSAATLAIALSSTAQAQCAAEGAQVLCAGQSDPFVMTVPDGTVTVQKGATVGSQTTPDAALRFDVSGKLIVNGTAISQGPAVLLGDSQRLDVKIGKSGMLAGANAIRQSDDNGNFINLDNAGLVRGTDGAAVRARSARLNLNNRAGARIEGGLETYEVYGANAGTIEAGDASAIVAQYSDFDNSGTITNSSDEFSTIVGDVVEVRNSGVIEARGTAPAIAAEYLYLTNKTGGVIRSAGDTAITVSGRASIDNAGAIVGGSQLGQYDDSFFQRFGGTVTGAVTMGAGDDSFWREGGANGLAALPTGGVDGGEGIDTYGIRMTGSGTVAFGALPTGFERYGLDLCGCNLDVTIAAEQLNGGLDVTGPGKVTNLADINYSGSGVGLTLSGYSEYGDNGGALTFVNRGTLNFTGVADPGQPTRLIDADSLTAFVNDTAGTINFSGEAYRGIYAAGFGNSEGGYGFVNRGTIHAEGAVSVAVEVNGTGYNSGTIENTSSGGYALVLGNRYASFVNDTGGVIRAENAVAMNGGSSLTNRGSITGTGTGPAITGTATASRGGLKLVNEGEIRAAEGAAAVAFNSSLPADTPLGSSLANKGTIVGDVVFEGNGKDMVWLAEGSTIQGNLSTGAGDDKLVVDLARLKQDGSVDTSGLVSGTVDMGAGNNVLQARAGSTQTFSVLQNKATGFTGGTVYEAAGAETVLTLQGPLDRTGNGHQSYDGLLRLAGDGRVVLDMSFNNGGYTRPSIVVEQSSTASEFGDNGNGLDLVIAGNVISGKDVIAVDATYARRVELQAQHGYIGIAGGIGLKTGWGTEVLISRSTDMRNTGTAYGVLIDATGSTIMNRSLIWEDGKSAANGNFGMGADLKYSSFTNDKSDLGTGWVKVQGIGIRMDNSQVHNRGDIWSAHDNAIELAGNGVNRLVNYATGTIQGHMTSDTSGTAGAAIVGSGYSNDIIENAGTISGHVLLGNGDDLYVAAGGKVTGDLDMGAGNDTVLTRNGAALDVTGTVTGGAGVDAYGRSFTTSGTFDLASNVLAAGFEMHGVEASGVTTEVTVTSASTLNTALRILGDGKVTNNASFNITDDSNGVSAAIEALDPRGEGDLEFVNNGKIDSVAGGVYSEGTLKSFVNTAAITARNTGVYIQRFGSGAFTMNNSGTITSTESIGLHVVADTYSEEGGNGIDVTNSGTISSGADGYHGVDLYSEYSGVKLGNSGTISAAADYATGAYVAGQTFDVTNSGTIKSTGTGGTGLVLTAFGGMTDEDCVDPQPALVGKLANSGTISANGGGSEVSLATGAFAVIGGDYGQVAMINAASGVIEATGGTSTALLVIGSEDEGYGSTGVDAALRLFEMDNLGTIRGGPDTALGGSSYFEAGGYSLNAPEDGEQETYVVAGGIQTLNTTDKIRNLAGGKIIGNVDLADGNDVFENYGTLEGDLRLGEGDDTFVYAASGTFTGTAYGGSGTDTLLVDVNGGGTVNFDQFRQFETLAQRGTGSITILGTTDLETLNMAGSNVTVAAGTRFQTQGATALQGSDAAESVSVFGTIGGGLDMGGGNDIVTLGAGGLVDGKINLGAGDDRLVLTGGTATGLIDGGDGIDTVAFAITEDTSNLPNVTNFESLDVSGNARLTLAMNQNFDTVTLRNGADLTLNPGEGDHHIGNIIGDDSAQSVILNTALTGGVSLGGGDDSLTMSLTGLLTGSLDGGAGNDVLNLNLTGDSKIAGGITSFETINVAGGSTLTLGSTIAADQTLNFDEHDNTLIVEGGSILGTVNGGAGHDALVFTTIAEQTSTLSTAKILNFEDIVAQGAGTLAITGNGTFQTISVDEGDLTVAAGSTITAEHTNFGASNNVLTLASGATLSGAIDGGDGTDRLVLNQAANSVRKLSTVNATGFEELESGDAGELIIDRDAQFDVVDLFGAKMTVAAGSTLTVPTLNGNDGANHLNVQGTLAGNVALGAGDDRLTLGHTGLITGTASGGTGYDTLEFNTTGTYAAPTTWNGQGYDEFEAFNVAGGVVSLTGNVSYDTISVTGGRLIGQAGTTITSAKTLVVSHGATFGSAGTVNANIEVRGTLSPGASPGTMTVNGNVLFTNGSNLLLEMSPTVSDRLNISGTMTIQTGATLDITGILQSTPGGALDLVVAQGGITGGFTTINKSETVFGFVVTRGNRIQLVGEFQNSQTFGTNVQGAITYANAVLGGSQMVQAFTNALPSLVETNGASRAAGFAALSPEAFAAADQASIENGLAVVDTMRTLENSGKGHVGFYGFAQGLYQEGTLQGNAVSGAHDLRSDSRGLLGGFGWGFSETARVNAFVGTLATNQTVENFGASTKLEGMQVGVSASAELGGLALRGLVAYDLSQAKTRRAVPNGTATSRYDLGGFVADMSAGYQVSLGSVRITPRVGLTYVEGGRNQVTEKGSDFALDVTKHSSSALFGDAALGVSFDLGGVTPWAEAGIRHQLSGTNGWAAASYAAASSGGVMVAEAATRGDTMAHLSLGVTAPVTKGVRLNLSYSGEYGAGVGGKFGDTARHSVNAGLSVAF